ncbi:hypothetical protein DFH06DRAFT_1153020 [Mycena polygramma]|nr:hypothetical protein DFH06DRAFT_1153020 [Mycena polygramma]
MTQPSSAERMKCAQEPSPERDREFRKEGNSRRAARRGGNGKHQRCKSGSRGSAEQTLKSSAKGVTLAQMIWTRVGGWNVHEERENPEVDRAKLRSNHIPTEIFGDIRICGGFKAVTQPTSCSNTPEVFGTKADPRPRVPRGICREGEGSGNGNHRRCRPKTGGMTEVQKMQTKCREVERFGNKGRRVGQSSGAMQQGRSDHIPTEIFGDIRICGGPKTITQPANCSSTREMSGTGRTETEVPRGTSRRAAKRIEGEHRKLPEVQTEDWRGRPSEIPDSNGASETQGRKVTEIRESRRKIWPGPGEDVWDFGKDVRDPERPESFSGASLGNRKSQNTIRTSVRDTESKPSANGKDRGRAEATGSTGRFGSKPKGEGEEGVEVEDEPNETGRTRWFGTDSRSRKVEGKNREIPGIRCPKSRKRPRWKRGSAEASETRSRSEHNQRGQFHKRHKVMCAASGGGQNSLRLREEWKGGKEVVNDPDRSRSRGRAEDRRRPEIGRVDGEVARADRSTEGQRPEVVRMEVGGRIGGEPEQVTKRGRRSKNMRMRQLERRTIRTDKRKYTLSEDLGAAESADSAGLIGIGGGIVGDANWPGFFSFTMTRLDAKIVREPNEPQLTLFGVKNGPEAKIAPKNWSAIE